MKDEDRKKIEEIMAGMQCSKNFKCAESGFERLCKAEDTRLEGYLNCLEGNPLACSFAVFSDTITFAAARSECIFPRS